MANVNIELGYKPLVWFTANPTIVLLAGQIVYLEQTGTYKIGDGVSTLSALSFLGVSSEIQTLQNVTDLGNTTTNDIQFDAGVGVLLDNTSRLREGTIDAGYGGNKGIAQICAVGYELKWESGSLYVMDGNGTHIRHSLYNFASVPSITEDITKGFLVGTRWSLDNGDVYVCTDNSIGAAVWVLQSNGVPTLAQVLASGNTTGGNKIQSDGFVSMLDINDASIYLSVDGGNSEFNMTSSNVAITTVNNVDFYAPSVTRNGVEIATVNDIPTKTSDLINDGDDGNPFISLNDLPSNLILYATTAASDIPTYVKLVSSITDPSYNTVAVNVSTGSITTTNQFISSLITSPNVIVGNPGVLNITTIGNIRRTAGTGNAEFYFEVYKRVLAGTETLITTSGNTLPVFNGTYAEFSATALWNDGIFLATDRIVLKFYGTRISGGSNPTYDFQFGGSSPVRSLVPIPLTVSPTPLSELIINKQNSLAVDGTATKYPTVDAVNAGLATKGSTTLDNLIFSGSYMPAKLGYVAPSHTAGINGFLVSKKMGGRKTCTITSLSVWALTGVAGGNVRLAIYSDLNGLPNTLIVETGNIACTSSGLKEGVITPTTLLSGTTYHIAHQVSSGTISLKYNISEETNYYDPTNFVYVFNVSAAFVYAAFPSTFPAVTYQSAAGFSEIIYLKQQ
jgi:hypothetical protein